MAGKPQSGIGRLRMEKKMKQIYQEMPTPAYVVEEKLLRQNLELLRQICQETGCKILLAQKAFSMYHFYPLIGRYLHGATASGIYEAKLAAEEMPGKENHIFSPAYKEKDMEEILQVCDHIVFNSFVQWKKYRKQARKAGKECGLRINPEHSTQEHAIYDPCAPGSRLGITPANFEENELDGITGLHFHCLCEQNADALEETLQAVEEKFGKYLYQMKWLNFGGGHHITRADYDVEKLKKLITYVQDKYQVQVYLEPGEAVALRAGYLITEVLEIVQNGGMQTAVLDTSAACHMPDVLEMPYRPPLYGSGEAGEKKYTYRLGGPTCLAGDIIGDYSFDEPLKVGARLCFEDMAIYSMVKNNTFNGMPLPDIIAVHDDDTWEVVKHFGYQDFKQRL